MLPEFVGPGYQSVWSFMVGLYVLAAVVVILIARPKRLITTIP